MTAPVKTTIRTDPELWQQVREAAVRERITIQAWLERAIRAALAERKEDRR